MASRAPVRSGADRAGAVEPQPALPGAGGTAAAAASWRPAGRGRIGAGYAPARHRRSVVIAATVLGVLIAAVLLAPVVAPLDQRLIDLRSVNRAPSLAHPFGTDEVGRDVLLRSIYGLRVSLVVGVVAAVVSTLIGGVVGIAAGAFGGWTDRVLMRVLDAMASLPHLLLGIFIVALFAPSAGAVIVSVAVTHWLSTARIVRSEVLSLRERLFVDAAVSAGSSRARILWRHFLPNVAPSAVLATVLMVPHAIFHESALSYLGLGLPPHLASLGNMINDGQRALFGGVWWSSLFPGLLIVVPTLAISALSQRWRDRLHPRRRSELQL